MHHSAPTMLALLPCRWMRWRLDEVEAGKEADKDLEALLRHDRFVSWDGRTLLREQLFKESMEE